MVKMKLRVWLLDICKAIIVTILTDVFYLLVYNEALSFQSFLIIFFGWATLFLIKDIDLKEGR